MGSPFLLVGKGKTKAGGLEAGAAFCWRFTQLFVQQSNSTPRSGNFEKNGLGFALAWVPCEPSRPPLVFLRGEQNIWFKLLEDLPIHQSSRVRFNSAPPRATNKNPDFWKSLRSDGTLPCARSDAELAYTAGWG